MLHPKQKPKKNLLNYGDSCAYVYLFDALSPDLTPHVKILGEIMKQELENFQLIEK